MTESQTDTPEASAAHGVWCLYSAGLFMRADSTDAGQLVRLADVVRWLMHRDSLPIVEAVESVCSTLESALPAPSLFSAVEHRWASPMKPDDSFGFFTEETIARAKRIVEPIAQGESTPMHPIKLKDYAPIQFLIGGVKPVVDRDTAQQALDYLNKVKPVQPGALAAAQYMRDFWAIDGWGSYFSRRDWPSDATLDKRELKTCGLSVRIADAAALWGWGRALELVSAPQVAAAPLDTQAEAPQPLVHRIRADMLVAPIRKAQNQVENPGDVHSVFAILRTMAKDKNPPFIGSTEEGLQWLDSQENLKILSVDALRKRLARNTKNAR